MITEEKKRQELAALNLKAGRKAKAASAYGPAATYLSSGVNLLPDQAWKSHYELRLGLLMEKCECEFLLGNFDSAEACIDELLTNAATQLDRARVYRLQVVLYTTLGKLTESLELGRKGLELLDIKLPEKATKAAILKELLKTKWLIRNKGNEQLLNLPKMTALFLRRHRDPPASLENQVDIRTVQDEDNDSSRLDRVVTGINCKHGDGDQTGSY